MSHLIQLAAHHHHDDGCGAASSCQWQQQRLLRRGFLTREIERADIVPPQQALLGLVAWARG